jgi:peptidoglycan/LPS O-acetylase OafA/YrhL
MQSLFGGGRRRCANALIIGSMGTVLTWRTGHNPNLQALRGLAALCVLGGHGGLVLGTRAAKWHFYAFQPNAAVLLFYVLSGYVLALSLGRDGDLFRFAVRRAFRILPVYWVGVFVGAGSHLLTEHPALDGATQWFNGTIEDSAMAVQWANIWPNLYLWTTSMSGVLWSIQVELFAAPLIPLMLWLSKRVPWFVDIAIMAALTVLMKYLIASKVRAEVPQIGFLAYLVCFYLGVALPKLLANAAVAPFVRNPILAVAAWLLSFVALKLAGDLPAYVIATTLISGWLVAFAATSPDGLLSARPLVWLGDISYSFYVYATPTMIVVGLGLLFRLPPAWRYSEIGSVAIIWLMLAITLAIALPAAYVSYRLIELPLSRFGARLVSRRGEEQAEAGLYRPAAGGTTRPLSRPF